MSSIEKFLRDHKIEEVECLVPDMAGIARGKILPAERFVDGMKKNGLRIPEALFVQTVTGNYPDDDNDTVTDPATSDVYLTPDPETIRIVPWYPEPTAQVICDPSYFDGSPVAISARQVLKRVIALYAENKWKALVAPELEFFLVDVNTDPDYPLEPPIGRSGRAGDQPPGLRRRRGERVRPPVRGDLRLLRGPGYRHRYTHTRGRRRPDGVQLRPRRAAQAGGPGLPV